MRRGTCQDADASAGPGGKARTVRLAVRVDPQALHGVAPRAAADRDVADHGAHRNRVRDQTRVVLDLGLRQRAGALTDLRVGPRVAVGGLARKP